MGSHPPVGILCLRFRSQLCRDGKIVPKIQFGLLQGLQNIPKIQGMKMQGLQNSPRIQGKGMQGLQKYVRVSVWIFARYAMRQTGFSLDFSRVCNEDLALKSSYPGGVNDASDSGKPYPDENIVPENQFELSPGGV